MPKKHHRRPLCGRHLAALGAIALAAQSGYELWIRFEDFWAWTAGIRHLSAVRGTPFWEDLAIVFEAPEMRALGCKLVFLLVTALFALICLIRRSRARGAWLIILLDLAAVAAGVWLGVYGLHPTDWAQTVKLLPLALILAGNIANIIHRATLRRASRDPREPRELRDAAV